MQGTPSRHAIPTLMDSVRVRKVDSRKDRLEIVDGPRQLFRDHARRACRHNEAIAMADSSPPYRRATASAGRHVASVRPTRRTASAPARCP